MGIDILNTVESSIKSNETESLKKISTMGPAKLRKLGLGPVNRKRKLPDNGKRKREIGLVIPVKYDCYTNDKRISSVLDEEIKKRKD